MEEDEAMRKRLIAEAEAAREAQARVAGGATAPPVRNGRGRAEGALRPSPKSSRKVQLIYVVTVGRASLGLGECGFSEA
eukprot:6173120-Pleurochrysis_carterae.AAC.2